MGLFDKSALPKHLQSWEAWVGKDDDDHWYTRWRKYVKAWSAFGPRSPKGIAFAFILFPPFIIPVLRKWREFPIVLVALSGGGPLRWESTDGSRESIGESQNVAFIKNAKDPEGQQVFLSRVQLWCRWHIQIQWPLFFCFHFYKNKNDILPLGDKVDRDGKLFMAYWGAKRDADRVFWFVARYIGRNFK